MMFQDFDLKTKRLLLLFLLCLFAWWLLGGSVTASASGTPEPVYQITETELVTLENNLAQLRSINESLQRELAAQKRELYVLKQESSQLVNQLRSLQQQSLTQQELLTNANRSLEEYATEAKRTRLRIKAQRNGWAAAAACLVVALAVK